MELTVFMEHELKRAREDSPFGKGREIADDGAIAGDSGLTAHRKSRSGRPYIVHENEPV